LKHKGKNVSTNHLDGLKGVYTQKGAGFRDSIDRMTYIWGWFCLFSFYVTQTGQISATDLAQHFDSIQEMLFGQQQESKETHDH
jgi:hypothetical protein